jgi:hypothetical protein
MKRILQSHLFIADFRMLTKNSLLIALLHPMQMNVGIGYKNFKD